MKHLLKKVGFAALLCAGTAMPAHAAPVDFDCDAPADRVSMVSQPAGPTLAIAGTFVAVEVRPSKVPTSGGVQFIGIDGKVGVAIQFVVPTPKSPTIEIRAIVLRDGKQTAQVLGTVPVGKPDPHSFSFTLTTANKATFAVDGKAYTFDFPYLPAARSGMFCGSSHVRFISTTLTP